MIILVLPRYYDSGSPRCVFYEEEGLQCSPEDFRQYVPDAMDAEAWFRHHNRYANGEPIIGKGTTRSALCSLWTSGLDWTVRVDCLSLRVVRVLRL